MCAQVVDVGFQVVQYSLLKEIGSALQRDHVHEVAQIGDIVHLVAKGYEEVVSDKSIYWHINVVFMLMSTQQHVCDIKYQNNKEKNTRI